MIDVQKALLVVGLAVGTYILGSINFSIVLARLLGKPDPRKFGSKNAGATNMARTAGKPAAVAVLLLDLGRAFVVIWGTRALGLQDLAPAMALPLLLGNLYPVLHRFRGGKGVAASVGAMVAIAPPVMLFGGGVFLLAAALFRRVSIGSILMCASYPAWFALFNGTTAELATAATIAAVVVVTHRRNIARLARGVEPRIGERRETEQAEADR
ncbi:MAG: glycerol-3-phosphate 1-O-acyltransferase PlsY [Deltaproteobacteria bacterium]|nr:glycerol-3-phosphate 1-O-acyltransferase PlsY [Deltaproteobacteria bacterium]